jgi:tetratricopeptide (TPR) repeat protein
MIVLPALLLGIWLCHWLQPRTFKWALPAVLAANLLLPAAHVMWNLRIPIYYLHAVRALKTPSFLDPQVYLQKGQASLEQGKLAEATTAFETALKLNDRFAPAVVYRALTRMRQDDLIGASQDAQLALTLEPGLPDALFVRALIAKRRDDTASAKVDVQNALKDAPADWSLRSQAQGFLDELNKPGS